MDKQSIGESQITPQIQQQVAPDVANNPQELQQHLGNAAIQKAGLDFLFKGIAQKFGDDFSSRVKNPETTAQKIVQKRIQGDKNYEMADVNDIYGGRIIVSNTKKIPAILGVLQKIADAGVFKILESGNADNGTYHAYHIDFKTASGVRGELQIHTPQSEVESVVNHDLRAVHGENPPENVEKLRQMQAAMTQKLPADKAKAITQAIQDIHKKNNDKPISPLINASILSHIANSQ